MWEIPSANFQSKWTSTFWLGQSLQIWSQNRNVEASDAACKHIYSLPQQTIPSDAERMDHDHCEID